MKIKTKHIITQKRTAREDAKDHEREGKENEAIK